MKVESHNHPSAIEPLQGAATGVGGIIRDIFAMGARPIAMLDSLRFGPLQPASDTPADVEEAAHNRHLFKEIVAGIGWYGNCIGLPTVGGETVFSSSYNGNPLVNAMCVGVARVGDLVKARADGPGNPLILVGADTGRDGIHGATFASVELNEQSEERRPAVQVGNPFMEKLLMEALPRARADRLDRWVARPWRCRADKRRDRMRLEVGNGSADRRVACPAPRGGNDGVRSHALRIARAHAGHCKTRVRARGPGAVRALGAEFRRDR